MVSLHEGGGQCPPLTCEYPPIATTTTIRRCRKKTTPTISLSLYTAGSHLPSWERDRFNYFCDAAAAISLKICPRIYRKIGTFTRDCVYCSFVLGCHRGSPVGCLTIHCRKSGLYLIPQTRRHIKVVLS